MPVIKSAKKKLRQDKKRQLTNKKLKNSYKELLKQTKTNPSADSLSKAFSNLDKAAKNGIIHPNKAARLKSSLTKIATSTPKKTPTASKPSSKK